MRIAIAAFLLLLVAACTPGDVQYCQNKGLTPQTAQWADCFSYYHRNKEAFEIDRGMCMREARQVYPSSLYDRGYPRTYIVPDRYGRGHIRRFYDEPDYYRNQELDELTYGLLDRCMRQKGWRSADTWEAGGRKAR